MSSNKTENVVLLNLDVVEKMQIDQAARLANMTLEVFIIKTAMRRSKKIINERLKEK